MAIHVNSRLVTKPANQATFGRFSSHWGQLIVFSILFIFSSPCMFVLPPVVQSVDDVPDVPSSSGPEHTQSVTYSQNSAVSLLPHVTRPDSLDNTKSPQQPAPLPVKTAEAQKVAICAIQKYGMLYLEEWIDYNAAIGFSKIYVYDNSDNNELKHWSYSPENILEIVHFPGEAQKMSAYDHCAQRIKQEKLYQWAAFFDLDEFLVLKRHSFVQEMLQEVSRNFNTEKFGGLAVNWVMFDFNDHVDYQPLPVLKRFQRRDSAMDQHVKVIVYMENYERAINPHAFLYNVKEMFAIDTTGKQLNDDTPWFNQNGPGDVVVLHHYHSKSVEEYRARCGRSKANMSRKEILARAVELYCFNKDEVLKRFKEFCKSNVMETDDTAWKILTRRWPQKYH